MPPFYVICRNGVDEPMVARLRKPRMRAPGARELGAQMGRHQSPRGRGADGDAVAAHPRDYAEKLHRFAHWPRIRSRSQG